MIDLEERVKHLGLDPEAVRAGLLDVIELFAHRYDETDRLIRIQDYVRRAEYFDLNVGRSVLEGVGERNAPLFLPHNLKPYSCRPETQIGRYVNPLTAAEANYDMDRILHGLEIYGAAIRQTTARGHDSDNLGQSDDPASPFGREKGTKG